MLEGMYFEDFRVGDRITTAGRTITAADVGLFAAWGGDWHRVHSDAEWAKHTTCGERLAPGLLTLDVSSGLLFLAGNGGIPRATLALWGLEKARFIAPTKIGDTLRVEGEVAQLATVDGQRGLITFRQRVVNQHDQEVLTYTSKLLVARRPDHVGSNHKGVCAKGPLR